MRRNASNNSKFGVFNMTKRKVFVSGPIQGMEKRQSYRTRLGDLLLRYGYEPIDPWHREKVMYSAPGTKWWRNVPPEDFIQRDLEDIDRCDFLLAYLPKLSAGTCMELFYAKREGKKTIVICQIEDPSPWIVEHSDIFLKTIEEFEKLLKDHPQ